MLRTLATQGAAKALWTQAAAATATRGFADAVATIDPKGDFSQLAGFVTSPEGKREFGKLQQAINELKRQEETLSAPTPAINWDNYADLDDDVVAFVKNIATEADGLMSKIDPAASDAAAAIKAIESKKKDMVAAAALIGKSAATEAAALQTKIAELDDQLSRIGTMTLDDYLTENPEVLAKIDGEISKGELF